MLQKIDHVGIAVFDMDESLRKYEQLFGAKAVHVETRNEPPVRFAFVSVGENMLELLAPAAPGSRTALTEFLDKHGEGLHHIAYRVEDVSASLAEMKKAGVKLRNETPRLGVGGAQVAFLDPEETGQVLTELVQRDKELV